jgi:uncharacterized protein YjiS (DUF1127 family)
MQILHGCAATFGLSYAIPTSYLRCECFRCGLVAAEKDRTMLSHLIRMFRAWRRYEASMRELSRLNDRELADIGVSRSDIHRIAWETARG